MNPLTRFLLLLAGCLAGAPASTARSQTIRTIDDKKIVGALKGFEDGKLVVQPSSGGAQIQKIPLVDIVDVTLRSVAAQSPALADTNSRAGKSTGGAWASLADLFSFGGGTTPSAPATTVEVTETAPVATIEGAPAIVVAPATTTSPAKPVEVKVPAAIMSAGAASVGWQVELAGGDHFRAALGGWTEDRLVLTFEGLDHVKLDVAAERVHALWSLRQPLVQKARAFRPTGATQDVAFVEKDGEVKTVAGVATGIKDDSLLFKYDGEVRRIKLPRLVGVRFAQRMLPLETSLFQTFTLVSGDTISGRIESVANDRVKLTPLGARAEPTAKIELPLSQLATIDVRNGRLTWLGDLVPSAVTQAPYFDRLMPYRVNTSLTGGALALADGPVSKGIAVHTRCVLNYDLDGSFERLRAKVGFQQPEGKLGRAVVRILGDGRTLWEEHDLRGDAAKPVVVDLKVVGIRSLRLEADYGPNHDVGGRVVWGEARLVKAAK
jgi:hypothetical protein